MRKKALFRFFIFTSFIILLITGCVFNNDYTVTIKACPKTGGEVSFNETSWAGEHTRQFKTRQGELAIFARPSRGHQLAGWYRGSTLLSTNSSHTVTVDSDITFRASFTSLRALEFEDPELERAVRKTGGYTGPATGTIYPEDVLGIRELEIVGSIEHSGPRTNRADLNRLIEEDRHTFRTSNGGTLTSLEGIQALKNLEWLFFPFNSVEDITPLRSLKRLEILYFWDNRVTDITPLVENPGIDEGDVVKMEYNYLNTDPDSETMAMIQQLEERGIDVGYKEQKAYTRQYTLSVQATPALGGNIQIGTDPIGDAEQKTVGEGTRLEIQAFSESEYTFTGWYEGEEKLSEDNLLSVKLTSDRTLEANFERLPPGYIDPDSLKELPYISSALISSSDNNNQIVPDSEIAVRTTSGLYGTIFFMGREPELMFQYTVYNSEGGTEYMEMVTVEESSMAFDIDRDGETDFTWQTSEAGTRFHDGTRSRGNGYLNFDRSSFFTDRESDNGILFYYPDYGNNIVIVSKDIAIYDEIPQTDQQIAYVRNADCPVFQAGDIVIDTNNHLMRKAAHVETHEDYYLLHTEWATLEEAFKSLNLNVNFSQSPRKFTFPGRDSERKKTGERVGMNYGGSFELDVHDIPGIPDVITGTLSGELNVGAKLLTEFEIGWASSNRLAVYLEGGVDASIAGKLGLEGEIGGQFEKDLSNYIGSFSKTIWVYYIPVEITIKPILEAEYSADGWIGIESEAAFSQSMKTGFEIGETTGFDWIETKLDKSVSFDFDPSIKGSAEFKPKLILELQADICWLAGPTFELYPYLRSYIDTETHIHGMNWDDLDVQFNAGLDFGVETTFGLSGADWLKDIGLTDLAISTEPLSLLSFPILAFDIAHPARPDDLMLSLEKTGEEYPDIQLNFRDNSAYEDYYDISRSFSPGNYSVITKLPSNTSDNIRHNDAIVPDEETYYYKVQGYDVANFSVNPFGFKKEIRIDSAFSNVASITLNPPEIKKVDGKEGLIYDATNTFTWEGSDTTCKREIVKYLIRKDFGEWEANTPPELNEYTWSNYSTGTHVFEVKAVDDDELESNIVRWQFEYDVGKPVVEKISGKQGIINDPSNTFTWRGEDTNPGGTVEHYEYRKDNSSWKRTEDRELKWQGYDYGTHTFSVRAVDDEGYLSEPARWRFDYSTATVLFSEDFETGDFSNNAWRIGGESIQVTDDESFEGNYCAKLSYDHSDSDYSNAISFMMATITLNEPAVLSFFRKLEYAGTETHDYTNHFDLDIGTINENGAFEKHPEHPYGFADARWQTDWEEVVRMLPEGTHVLRWSLYCSSVYPNKAPFTAYIDNITILPEMDLGHPVAFPPEWKRALYRRYHIGLTKDAQGNRIIYSRTLKDIMWFSYYRMNLKGKTSNLSGLEEMENLRILELSPHDNHLEYSAKLTSSDLAPIQHLPKLRILDLSKHAIKDLTFLRKLKSLTRLTLNNNSLSDLKPVSNLHNLRWLSLNENNISDLRPVSNLHNLRYLKLSENNISNIAPLSGLTELKGLLLENNNIKEITALQELNLNSDYFSINLSHNYIEDIGPLAANKGLDEKCSVSLFMNNLHFPMYNIIDPPSPIPGDWTDYYTLRDDKGVKICIYPQRTTCSSTESNDRETSFHEKPPLDSEE